jgi:hypothetical protein
MIPGATPLMRIPIAASRGARERMRPFMPVVIVSLMGVDAVGREMTGAKSTRTNMNIPCLEAMYRGIGKPGVWPAILEM